MSAGGADNINNINSNSIIFTIEDTNLYVPVVTLSTRDNKNHQNFLTKDLKDQLIAMNIKRENKNTTNKYRYFLEKNFGWS